jgi:hypothetical protein
MRLTILLLFISIGCFGQVTGTAKSYSELTQADKLQRSIDSLNTIDKVNAEFLATVKRDATIRTLKTKAYTALNNVTVGATLTSAQLQAAAWISLWNAGAINSSTNKIDSTFNYIK